MERCGGSMDGCSKGGVCAGLWRAWLIFELRALKRGAEGKGSVQIEQEVNCLELVKGLMLQSILKGSRTYIRDDYKEGGESLVGVGPYNMAQTHLRPSGMYYTQTGFHQNFGEMNKGFKQFISSTALLAERTMDAANMKPANWTDIGESTNARGPVRKRFKVALGCMAVRAQNELLMKRIQFI